MLIHNDCQMNMATEKYGKLLYSLIEMQQLGAQLLGQLSVEHAQGNSVDENTAFANILDQQEANLKNLKSINYPCNKAKIYDGSQNPPAVLKSIDVKMIDSTLQKDVLFYLEGFPTSKPRKTDRNKKVKCGSCGKSAKKEDFCCGKCNWCKNCNENQQPAQQCPIFILNLGLETDRLLRNLVSHLTIQSLKNFLDRKETFIDFPHVNNWQGLSQEFVNTMNYISQYMCSQTNFTNGNVIVLQAQDKINKLSKLKLILKEDTKVECDLNLLLNLKQAIKEQHLKQIGEHQKQINEIEKVVKDLKDTMERNHKDVSTKLDKIGDGMKETNKKIDQIGDGMEEVKKNINDIKNITADMKKTLHDCNNREISKDDENEMKLKEEIKSWRNIAGGVVIQLDSTDSQCEVSYVSYCDVNHKIPVKVNHKAAISQAGEPYYETHMIDDSSLLLKIEYLKDGDYIIEVVTGSVTDRFNVSISYKFNDPARKIQSKIGIVIPCSDNTKYWEELIKLILDPSMNEDRILTLYYSSGASYTTDTLTMKAFEQVGTKYLKVNFDDQNLLIFPPFHTIDDERQQTLVKLFKKILQDKYTAEQKGAILVAPNHTYLSGLINTAVGTKIDDCNDEKCLLVFVEKISLVLAVRIASDAANIKEEIFKCQDNINKFTHVNGHRIVEEGINIAGIIACPSVERKELKNILPFEFADVHGDIYESLFICKDDLKPETNSFHNWWDNSIKDLQRRLDLATHRSFTKMIGQYMVVMATVKESLPTISFQPHEQLMTLILNEKQLSAIHSPSMKKYIVGPFGSGKTVVGQAILKNLFVKLKRSGEASTLMYVTCDNYSIIDSHIKTSMEGLADANVQFICGSLRELYREYVDQHSSSSSFSLDRLMKEFAENFPNAHFVCDEVQCSVMTEDVARNIEGYLQNVLRNSHVVFIQQSMNKKRECQQCSLEADNFHLISGLEKHQLHSVMRMAVGIQMLIDSAQELITNHKVMVRVPKLNSKQSNTIPAEKLTSLNVSDIDKHDATAASNSKKLVDKISVMQENSKNTFEDFDASLKIFSQALPSKTTQNTVVVTTDVNVFSGKKGHEISSGRPQLIFLPKTNEIETIKVLSLVLNNCCFHKTPVLIANSLQSARLLHHSTKCCNKKTVLYIPYLQRRTPTTEEKGIVKDKSPDSIVLITDHKSFLGMEHEVVVTIVDPSENITRDTILEIISRCTSKLFVFVLPQINKSEPGSMGEILDRWREDNLVDTMFVRLEVDNGGSGSIKIKDNQATIYTQSENFKALSDDIERFGNAEFREDLPDEETSKFLHAKIAEVYGEEEDKEQSIIHEVTFEGKVLSFYDVYKLLKEKQFNVFRKLYQDNKNILNNLRSEHDNTFLIHYPTWNIIKHLLEQFHDEIDVWAVNVYGRNAYHYAALHDHVDVMKLLLSFNRSGLDNGDHNKYTPLHRAAGRNSMRMVEVLINAGASVDVVNNDGDTPDCLSSDENIVKMIKLRRRMFHEI